MSMPMYPGETLREILQRDDGFSDLRGLLRDLEGLVRSCRGLREEIEQLLLKIVLGSPDASVQWATSGPHVARLLRSIMEGRTITADNLQTIRVIVRGREFRIPSPPQKFSAEVNSWIELPERGKVLAKEIELDSEETELNVLYESGNLWGAEPLHGDPLISVLTRFRGLVTKLMREALAGLKRYQRELEELKRQILRDYPREILMGDL
jgi:hypothetical protein